MSHAIRYMRNEMPLNLRMRLSGGSRYINVRVLTKDKRESINKTKTAIFFNTLLVEFYILTHWKLKFLWNCATGELRAGDVLVLNGRRQSSKGVGRSNTMKSLPGFGKWLTWLYLSVGMDYVLNTFHVTIDPFWNLMLWMWIQLSTPEHNINVNKLSDIQNLWNVVKVLLFSSGVFVLIHSNNVYGFIYHCVSI